MSGPPDAELGDMKPDPFAISFVSEKLFMRGTRDGICGLMHVITISTVNSYPDSSFTARLVGCSTPGGLTHRCSGRLERREEHEKRSSYRDCFRHSFQPYSPSLDLVAVQGRLRIPPGEVWLCQWSGPATQGQRELGLMSAQTLKE